jgi:hypothetical protein
VKWQKAEINGLRGNFRTFRACNDAIQISGMKTVHECPGPEGKKILSSKSLNFPNFPNKTFAIHQLRTNFTLQKHNGKLENITWTIKQRQ